jgi:hypothetical protein
MRPLIASIVLVVIPALGFAQGALTPPSGAPAPTMKTLDQLEPRTPLKAGATGVTQNANGGFTIKAPGSYYLTANLTITSGDAIVITASDVTLDLSGFTLSSTTVSPAAGTGVYIADNLSNITIRNGHIRGNTVYNYTDKTFTGTGFRNGIQSSVLNPNTVAENISVSNIIGDGIANFKKIDKCATSVCGGMGLVADQVQDSSAVSCGLTAVRAYYTASNCLGESINSTGLHATTASNCSGRSDSGTALSALTASNCWAYTTSGSIAMEITGAATNCRGDNASGGTSIKAAIAVSCTTTRGAIDAPQKFLGTP